MRSFAIFANNKGGHVQVRDNDGYSVSVALKSGQASRIHEFVGLSFSRQLAAAVVHTWTAEEKDAKISCLYNRVSIAVALSKLMRTKCEKDADMMKFISSAVFVHEQGIETQMALKE